VFRGRRISRRTTAFGAVVAAALIAIFLLSRSVGVVLVALPAVVLGVALYWSLIRAVPHPGRGHDGADPYLSTVYGGYRITDGDLEASIGEPPPGQVAPERKP
jgi:hypothetical protein